MNDIEAAREAIATLDIEIAKVEQETRERVARIPDTEQRGPGYLTARQEWSTFEARVRPLRDQREVLVKAIATIEGLKAPAPIIVPR